MKSIKIQLFIIWLIIIFSVVAAQAQKLTISGYVKDAANGEELIGASVYVSEIQSGTVTNLYGFYSITLAPGTYTLTFSNVGFQKIVKQVNLTEKNISLNIELSTDAIQTEEVVITGEKDRNANVQSTAMSKIDIDVRQVKKLPALFGEADIIKSVQMQPGVVSAGEGTSSYYVRGGSADQNLIVIDEAPVYDPSHLFGLFSAFNADVIKDAQLYKGGIPARYGGRLSSLLDVRTKDGNSKQFSANGGIGLLASRFMIEGPIVKDKSSYLLAGRRSYADLFLKLSPNENQRNNALYFYDLNGKINWKVDNKNRFFLSGYSGRDVLGFRDLFRFDWGNTTGTFRWNHLFNDKLFSNTTFIFSRFDYGLRLNATGFGFRWVSNITQATIQEDLVYYINPNNVMTFGYSGSWRQYATGDFIPENAGATKANEIRLPKLFALDHAFYVANEQKLNQRISMEYGLRLSIFQNVGKGTVYKYENKTDRSNFRRIDSTTYGNLENIKAYFNLEPRFSVRYLLDENSSIKASYNRMVQNTHLISSGTVPLPINTWYPSTGDVKPQIADQIAAGYFRNLKDNTIELSAEIFYKYMQNVTDFADNAVIFFNQDLPTEFRQGESWAYGLELFAVKKEGKFTGSAGYTLSWVQRLVPDVNQGKAFFANHDRRNNFTISGTYQLDDRWTFGTNFVYSTGRPITIPAGKYEVGKYTADLFTERNAYRLPAFHRLDISANLDPRKNRNRRFQSTWNFSIYNLYNRANPFTITTSAITDADGNVVTGEGAGKKATMIYLFTILPSATWNFKF
jgi:hypothetical protein